MIVSDIYHESLRRIKYVLGNYPMFSRWIFLSEQGIFKKLSRDEAVIAHLSKVAPGNAIFLHSSFGMSIRNQFLLWHPKNPYTMMKLAKLSPQEAVNSPFHPDQYSFKIIEKLMLVASGANMCPNEGPAFLDIALYELQFNATTESAQERTLSRFNIALRSLARLKRYDLINDFLSEVEKIVPSKREEQRMTVMYRVLHPLKSKIDVDSFTRIFKVE